MRDLKTKLSNRQINPPRMARRITPTNSPAKAIISSNQMTKVVPPAPVATAGFQSLRSLGKREIECGWLDMEISFLQNQIGRGKPAIHPSLQAQAEASGG